MGSKNMSYYTDLLNNGSTPIDDLLIHNDDILTNANISSGAPAMMSHIRSQNEPTTKKAQRFVNYSVEEDLVLVSAWLNIGLDPVKGNEQKSTEYWNIIWEYVHSNKTSDVTRSPTSLNHRWTTIQAVVNKFCGNYEQIINHLKSGEPEQDKIQGAKKMFKDHEAGAFMHKHSWNLLKYHEKWISTCAKKATNSRKGTKRRRSLNSSSPINLDEDNTPINLEKDNAPTSELSFTKRPIGRKQAKDLLKTEKAKDNLRLDLEEFKALKRELNKGKKNIFN